MKNKKTENFNIDEHIENLLFLYSEKRAIDFYKFGFNMALDFFLLEFEETIPRHNPVMQTVENIIEKLKRE